MLQADTSTTPADKANPLAGFNLVLSGQTSFLADVLKSLSYEKGRMSDEVFGYSMHQTSHGYIVDSNSISPSSGGNFLSAKRSIYSDFYQWGGSLMIKIWMN